MPRHADAADAGFAADAALMLPLSAAADVYYAMPIRVAPLLPY